VVPEAVRLDDEAERREVEVDAVAVDLFLGEGSRQAGPGRDREKAALQLGVCEAEGVAFEEDSERSDAWLSGPITKGIEQCLRVDEVAGVGFVDRTLKGATAEAGREVDKGSDRACRGDALVGGQVAGASGCGGARGCRVVGGRSRWGS
jgi:hypothetical protein